MIILDGEKLKDYWDSIAQGFEKSPLEAILSLVLIILIIIIPIILFILSRRKARKKKLKEEQIHFEEYMEKNDLSLREREILKGMSGYFHRNNLMDIFTHLTAFNTCAKELQKDKKATETEIAKLRIHLGLNKCRTGSALHSTAELYPGTRVKILLNKGRTYSGEIVKVDDSGITINTEGKTEAKPGQRIFLEFQRPSGCFFVRTCVSNTEPHRLIVAHSENIEKVQNRQFFRKNIRLPAFIQDNRHEIKTFLLDLSGGGARIKNEGLDYKQGQNLMITIPVNNCNLKIKAKVKRVSGNKSFVGLQFIDMKESVRDKIMKKVLS